jgi:hypothetical protein
MGTENSFPRVKQSGRKVHRSHPSSAGDKEWYPVVPVCPPGKHKDSLTSLHHEHLNARLYVSKIVKTKLLAKAENILELAKTGDGGNISCS